MTWDTKAVAEMLRQVELMEDSMQAAWRTWENSKTVHNENAYHERRYMLMNALIGNRDILITVARECEALRVHADTLDAYKAVGCTPAAMAELRASLAAREKVVLALGEALKAVVEFADRTAISQCQAGSHADELWRAARLAVASTEPATLAIEQRIRDEGIESAARVAELDSEGRSLHLAPRIRALKGTK